MNISLLYFFIFLSIISGCVGTVQETAPENTLKVENPPTTFDYSGITTSRAVSHNKIEIEFYPYNGSDVTYKLYINNAETPVTIDPQSLVTTNGGRLLYTIDNLQADREYKLKLRAFKQDASLSTGENEVYTKTFDNVVADFEGVSKISLVPGDTSGAIRIDWIAPAMSGIFTSGPFDPVHYEVSVISQIGGAPNLNNSSYAGTDKIVKLVPSPPARANPLSNPNSTTIEGLMPNTTYYVQVRAINTLWMNYKENPDVTNIPVSREVNTRYLLIKTAANDNLFDFNQSTIVLANAPGSDAFDKIDVFWQTGSGNFSGYRIFVKKYTGSADPTTDDQLIESNLQSMNSLGNYFQVNSSLTSKRITGLENGGYYQVKVALCKTVSCPVESTSPDAAIISDLTSIRIRPTLAPFSGIHAISPPGQFSEGDVVNLKFDAPLVSLGFATNVEFYCVNPADHTEMVRFDGATAISGSGVSRCNGLSLIGTIPSLDTYTSQKVKGINTNGTTEYCFAASPAIIGYGADVRLSPSEMNVRCSYPEIQPPTVAQFPGFSGGCSLDGLSAQVQWNLPTGGIYSNFKIFWKLKEDNNKFSFPEAIVNSIGYSSSSLLSAAATNFTISNLMPGEVYQVGVLSVADMTSPVQDLYSEYNLKVIDCIIPLPVATFKGFTRIFAIGPKLDGRIPNDPLTKSLSSNSSLFEAVNSDGIPYEVAMSSETTPHLTTNFSAPPGRDFGTSFGALFDGTGNEGGLAVSKTGVVALAWEEPEMSFPEAEALFVSNQPASPAPRSDRKWGFKIYRSGDNKLTWQELTIQSGLIYSTPYTYRKRPTSPAINTRMAFFTDYSVKALYDTHDAASGRDIDRARTYYYKIVPIFNGKTLKYSSPAHSIVRVTLPPPNMALVHRWMANRAICHELEKTPEIGQNYSCTYNGLGSRPASYPYRVGSTFIDQKGDLLIDRQELGCRYTRGDNTGTPELGASNFSLPNAPKRLPTDETFYPLFKGYRTVSETEDVTTTFRGCVGTESRNLGATGTGDDYPVGFTAGYRKFLQGDCLGEHKDLISIGACPAANFPAAITPWTINVPGADYRDVTPNCSTSGINNPTYATARYLGESAPNFVLQSEFLGVYFNTASKDGVTFFTGFEGPSSTSLSATNSIKTTGLTSYYGVRSSQCSINLAAIDGSGYMKPRWIDLNEASGTFLSFKGQTNPIITKSVAEITEVNATTSGALTFYNGIQGDSTDAAWKLPAANLRSSNRYRETTRLARIMTSNAAKLPPIAKLNQDAAQKICSTYWVQTGSASDNGNFLPDSNPVSKRLLRRAEFVAASAWQEHFDNNTILNLEYSSSPGSCNSMAKGTTGLILNKGDTLFNRSSAYLSSSTSLLTGSSPYHGIPGYTDNIHTSSCVSRYGIQDLIGNVAEHNSENIFCDYTKDRIYMGPVQASWSGGTGAENQGDGGPDLDLFNTNAQRANTIIVKNGTLDDGTNVSFKVSFRDGSPDMSDMRPWIKVSTESGYCSLVDANPNKRIGSVDFFKDVATGFWSPLYSPGGNLNSSIIERTQFDQRSVETLRNGDARYLDFGVSGLLPSLNSVNTLAMQNDTKAKYFNPVIGLPLICNNGSCEDPSLPAPNDNTSISSANLFGNITSLDMSPVITDFPIRWSDISSKGVSSYQYAATGYVTDEVPRINTYSMVISAIADDPLTMGNLSYNIKTRDDFQDGSTIDYFRVAWDLPRGSVLNFSSGGSSKERIGRYSASVQPSLVDDGVDPVYQSSSAMTDLSQGARCAVLINEEP